MTPLLLALAFQKPPALTPVDVRSPLFEAPRYAESLAVVSEDGAALIRGDSRVDLRTGKAADGEVLEVALRQPPRVYARSMSQGFGPTISPPGPLVFAPLPHPLRRRPRLRPRARRHRVGGRRHALRPVLHPAHRVRP